MLRICMLPIFACFSYFPVFRMCSADCVHIFSIFDAYFVHFWSPHTFSVCFSQVFDICSTYFPHCFHNVAHICCIFNPAHTFSVFVSHVFRICFTILSSEKRIVFRIFCAFRICCACVRASQTRIFPHFEIPQHDSSFPYSWRCNSNTSSTSSPSSSNAYFQGNKRRVRRVVVLRQ
jgi:hypothetical protein